MAVHERKYFISNNKIRSKVINILILISSCVILAIIAEVILRFLGMADPIVYRFDPVYGYEPLPNQSSNRLGIPIFINDVGLRDNENYADMDSSEIILLIGDSVTHGGSRTKQQNLFSEILEKKLKIHKAQIKVLNAGVNGYSISQMINRTKHLLQKIDPDYLIIYAIRADFFRAAVTYIKDGNFIYPTKKPTSALGDFLLLSINHLNKRYEFLNYLPPKINQLFKPPENYAPDYNKSNIKEIHINTIETFVQDLWEASGHSRDNIYIFLAPSRKDILENYDYKNSDLQQKFESMNLRFYDLQKTFFDSINVKDEEIDQYYWDAVHYREKGHSLAANVLYRYLISNKEFRSN